MKKIVLVLICILLLCGCTLSKDKFSDYEHYDLTDYHHEVYSSKNENYAVSVLTSKEKESDMEGFTEGILYEVGENDYILLDRFDGSNDAYGSKEYTLLYKDKLYIIRNLSPIVLEYTLDRENTKRNELRFDINSIIEAEFSNYIFSKIDGIDDEYIYLNGSIQGYNGNIPVADILDIHVKCSLKDYKCIESK